MNHIEKLIKELCPNGVEFKALGDNVEIYTGKQFNKRDMQEIGTYPVINGGIYPSGYIENFNETENTITISQGGASAGYVNFMFSKFWAGAHCYVVKPNNKNLINKFLYYFLKNLENNLMSLKYGAGIPALNSNHIKKLQIPLPPLEIQNEIVKILDTFTELETRHKQYEYYRERLLSFKALNA
ncbi:type I restriction-modification methylase [Helicobacter fennelliae]|uniref:Type I restriction-modification system, specificity subunit S n=2 Tax=Helicobacter fennelliae TaxID=215 RepID=T1CPM2_9HELI|nr:restriction endonuclease subunit S [Helicobacter fennelliae]GAD18704.1 type I restriction-modification system, specificity subunit S [Helicobacter fennelliae MRY12-0050]SQB97374.1 type I restriction-modification methylase [Helicobacter fennelliae]STP07124.1 type I restriction-modification methylase [Helicobacter fennelliae]STQ83328.1 type I restriction-modification methylase [Helicobacter fennelliae]